MVRLPKLLFAILVAAGVLLVISGVSTFLGSSENKMIVTLYPDDSEPIKIKAEIADSPEERAAGLMFRQSLGKNEGMLFVFSDSAVRSFWMKNTLIPLDMIFISENRTIAKIHHATPCTSDPCQLYSSEKPVKYVLEVNANLTSAYGIREGSAAKVSLPARLLK